MCRYQCAALLFIAASVLACSETAKQITGPPSRADLENAASRIAVALVAVAAGEEGAGFLDNFLPCTRRGVINYSNSLQGRLATFSGCELGAGVMIDGTGELRWAGPDLPTNERAQFCVEFPAPSCETALAWAGTLNVMSSSGGEFLLDEIRIDDLRMEPDRGLYPAGLRIATAGLGPVRFDVNVLDENLQVEDSSLPDEVFGSAGIDIDAIPNPSGSLDALTSADLERLAFDPALALFAFLLDEISDVRPDHTHDLDCGTSIVTFDPDRLPRIQNSWASCETLGVFVSGSFSVEFGPETNFATGPLTMLVQGSLTLGGGLPRIELARLEWSVASGASAAELRIFGALETLTGETRSFDLRAMADD